MQNIPLLEAAAKAIRRNGCLETIRYMMMNGLSDFLLKSIKSQYSVRDPENECVMS